MCKAGKGKRRGETGGNKIQQQAHVPVIINFYFFIAIVIIMIIIVIVIVIVIVIAIIIITLTEDKGLQEVGGGEGEAFLDRELHGRELRQPFIMMVMKIMLVINDGIDGDDDEEEKFNYFHNSNSFLSFNMNSC